jgi:dTDP-4-amino-4,6-dideoxygalactose transaminase
MTKLQVPFFRPALHEEEVAEVAATQRSGWLTSGPKVKRFEEEFAAAVAA